MGVSVLVFSSLNARSDIMEFKYTKKQKNSDNRNVVSQRVKGYYV